MQKIEILKEVRFGNQVAEEERDELQSYFVETDSWRKIIRGDVDVIYGPKGAGKSALYLLVQNHEDDLFDDGKLLVTAENPRGAPAFENLKTSPPPDERHFVNLWKLYFIALIGRELNDYELRNDENNKLISILRDEGLLPEKTSTLSRILNSVKKYIIRYTNPTAAETTIHTAESTGAIVGVTGKIYFSDHESETLDNKSGYTIDELYRLASFGLSKENLDVWLLLDRLDVAFDENEELEKNALRALFKAYRDIRTYDNIVLKIFLRTDIWERITDEGFREATHISREIRLEWDKHSLINLVARRFLNNKIIEEYYNVKQNEIVKDVKKQLEFLKKIMPTQVEIGSKQSETFDWILKRTTDGTGKNAPREIIVFFLSLLETQIKRLERGEKVPESTELFERASFKEALPALSEYRTTKVLFAEHPKLKTYIEKLSKQKSEHNSDSLARIWNIDVEKANQLAEQLKKIGFFESSERGGEIYKIPFIYRPFLEIVQGKAEELT